MSDYWSSEKIHFKGFCHPPGTVLYSTKSNITTPTTTQDRRAARAISSSTDIFSFPRSPGLLDLRELVCGAAAPLDPVAAEEEKRYYNHPEKSFLVKLWLLGLNTASAILEISPFTVSNVY